MKTYNILEIANVHAGSVEYMHKLLDEYEEFKTDFGIKFQPFKYDKIALADYAWYEVYKELYFSPEQWKNLILKASKTKDVWIDTFDEYTFQIVSENLALIKGLKFQASVLNNKKLIRQFSSLDFTTKTIILNISGIELDAIDKVVAEFKQLLNPKEIILQIGFQSYPTQMEDSGLTKIKTLQSRYNNDLSFADHIAPENEDGYILPVTAALMGVKYIEKHIRLSGEKPKYDFHSSMDLKEYRKYLEVLSAYSLAMDQPFINTQEENYLSASIQIPVLAHDMAAGKILSLNSDFEFKRSNQTGLRANEIENAINNFSVLSTSKKAFETLQEGDFKKANIASIIACRMKSSRLPKKAILPIGNLPSVELCIKNALSFKNVQQTILATSTVEEDAVLSKYTFNKGVLFHQGHPLDVMQRYIDAVEKYNIDVIIRITADMPYVSNEVAEIMLKSHFETGADYSRPVKAAIGTGLEIINTEALKRVKSYFPSADYSEYMTYYFTNNPAYFKINEVQLPDNLVRDYRLTLDYEEDLVLFNKVQKYLDDNKLENTLKNIYSYLDRNPEIASINKGLEVKYLTDKTLIDTLNKYTTIKSIAD